MHEVLEIIKESFESSKVLNELGLAAQRIIMKRTREGKDYQGNQFQSYSEAYKKKRQRAGLPTDPVNLLFNEIDGMMMSIDYKAIDSSNTAQLFFEDNAKARLAEFHNESGAGRSKVIREFWNLSEEEKEKLSAVAVNQITKEILRELK